MGGGAEGSALGRCFLSNIEDGERERSRRCARGRDLGLPADDAVILVGVCCGRGNLHVGKKERGWEDGSPLLGVGDVYAAA